MINKVLVLVFLTIEIASGTAIEAPRPFEMSVYGNQIAAVSVSAVTGSEDCYFSAGEASISSPEYSNIPLSYITDLSPVISELFWNRTTEHMECVKAHNGYCSNDKFSTTCGFVILYCDNTLHFYTYSGLSSRYDLILKTAQNLTKTDLIFTNITRILDSDDYLGSIGFIRASNQTNFAIFRKSDKFSTYDYIKLTADGDLSQNDFKLLTHNSLSHSLLYSDEDSQILHSDFEMIMDQNINITFTDVFDISTIGLKKLTVFETSSEYPDILFLIAEQKLVVLNATTSSWTLIDKQDLLQWLPEDPSTQYKLIVLNSTVSVVSDNQSLVLVFQLSDMLKLEHWTTLSPPTLTTHYIVDVQASRSTFLLYLFTMDKTADSEVGIVAYDYKMVKTKPASSLRINEQLQIHSNSSSSVISVIHETSDTDLLLLYGGREDVLRVSSKQNLVLISGSESRAKGLGLKSGPRAGGYILDYNITFTPLCEALTSSIEVSLKANILYTIRDLVPKIDLEYQVMEKYYPEQLFYGSITDFQLEKFAGGYWNDYFNMTYTPIIAIYELHLITKEDVLYSLYENWQGMVLLASGNVQIYNTDDKANLTIIPNIQSNDSNYECHFIIPIATQKHDFLLICSRYVNKNKAPGTYLFSFINCQHTGSITPNKAWNVPLDSLLAPTYISQKLVLVTQMPQSNNNVFLAVYDSISSENPVLNIGTNDVVDTASSPKTLPASTQLVDFNTMQATHGTLIAAITQDQKIIVCHIDLTLSEKLCEYYDLTSSTIYRHDKWLERSPEFFKVLWATSVTQIYPNTYELLITSEYFYTYQFEVGVNRTSNKLDFNIVSGYSYMHSFQRLEVLPIYSAGALIALSSDEYGSSCALIKYPHNNTNATFFGFGNDSYSFVEPVGSIDVPCPRNIDVKLLSEEPDTAGNRAVVYFDGNEVRKYSLIDFLMPSIEAHLPIDQIGIGLQLQAVARNPYSYSRIHEFALYPSEGECDGNPYNPIVKGFALTTWYIIEIIAIVLAISLVLFICFKCADKLRPRRPDSQITDQEMILVNNREL